MSIAIVNEFFGTFLLATVVLVAPTPFNIGATVAAALIAFNGQLNPALSLMLLVTRKLEFTQFLINVVAQCLGATTALLLVSTQR